MTVPMHVLSVFPGIDLFGRGFESAGFTVVRGPDPLFGSKIETFSPPADVYEGIIGGSPCQDFSQSRRAPPTGNGLRLIDEFLRVVVEASPDWFVLENVPRVPSINVFGYRMQRFNLTAAECGGRQRRLRTFQFGCRDSSNALVLDRCDSPSGHIEPCCMASEGNRTGRRSWADFCELQGLPRDFELPGLTIEARYRAVGNGVPVYMARVVAIAIKRRHVTPSARVCICHCGRQVYGDAMHATPACRKRMERRRRVRAAVTGPGTVTPATSQ
jgi:DNA (cytosine-5)-methyltransferase 1